MSHEPALSLSSLRSFFGRLFTWPFFAGLGTGIVLTIGGLLLSFIMVQQFGDQAGDSGTAPVNGPQISERVPQTVLGTVPDDWTLRPVSSDAEATPFVEATEGTTVVNL